MLIIQQLSQVVSEGAAVANAMELGKVNGEGSDSLVGKTVSISEVSCV